MSACGVHLHRYAPTWNSSTNTWSYDARSARRYFGLSHASMLIVTTIWSVKSIQLFPRINLGTHYDTCRTAYHTPLHPSTVAATDELFSHFQTDGASRRTSCTSDRHVVFTAPQQYTTALLLLISIQRCNSLLVARVRLIDALLCKQLVSALLRPRLAGQRRRRR